MPEHRMPDRIAECMSNTLPAQICQTKGHTMSECSPDSLPEHMPERMPNRMSECMSNRSPGHMSDNMSEDVPEHMPDRMSKRMTACMSEDTVCQIECHHLYTRRMSKQLLEDVLEEMPNK